jgi:hypothetical protein
LFLAGSVRSEPPVNTLSQDSPRDTVKVSRTLEPHNMQSVAASIHKHSNSTAPLLTKPSLNLESRWPIPSWLHHMFQGHLAENLAFFPKLDATLLGHTALRTEVY